MTSMLRGPAVPLSQALDPDVAGDGRGDGDCHHADHGGDGRVHAYPRTGADSNRDDTAHHSHCADPVAPSEGTGRPGASTQMTGEHPTHTR